MFEVQVTMVADKRTGKLSGCSKSVVAVRGQRPVVPVAKKFPFKTSNFNELDSRKVGID